MPKNTYHVSPRQSRSRQGNGYDRKSFSERNEDRVALPFLRRSARQMESDEP